MSFSSEQKSEILSHQYKNQCCRRAMLSGIVFSKALVQDEQITLSINSDEIISFVEKLVYEFYGKSISVFRSKTGGRAKIISFDSPAAKKYLSGLNKDSELFQNKCPFCKSAFLRACFLAAGRVCDPSKQYLLEFSLTNNSDILMSFLQNNGIACKYTDRKNEKILYVKKSSEIEDFFALAGMNATAFHFINTKIENEIRNNVNRVANCETNNIGKSVNASHDQIMLIRELDERKLLSWLPEELEKTARLRIQHEDLSLSALAKLAVPPISKSGLSHRLNKIMELGKSILKK